MNKLIIASMAGLLSFGAVACSSDSKSTSTTVASSTAESTGDSTVASSGAGALGTDQAAVLAKTEAEITKAGGTFDDACMSKLIAQLSDADAALILTAVPPNTVTASPAGEAIGKQLNGCVTAPAGSVPTT